MSLPRAEASRLRQADPLSNAFLAAFTALSTSAYHKSLYYYYELIYYIKKTNNWEKNILTFSASDTSVITFSVEGLMVENFFPLIESTHSLFINNWHEKYYLIFNSCTCLIRVIKLKKIIVV